MEEGEITSEEEPQPARRKKEKRKTKKTEKRQRIASISDHSNTETTVSVNGVKEVSLVTSHLNIKMTYYFSLSQT